jgi:hypothetical protein
MISDRREALGFFLSAPVIGDTSWKAFGSQKIASLMSNDGALLLPPGNYSARDIPIASNKLQLIAAIPGTVTIQIPSGDYLFDSANKVEIIHLEGIRFVGGNGVIRLRNSQENVTSPVTIYRCEFFEYTKCAIGNNSDNYPWLRVRECRFRCADGAHAIGIAWGGYIDCSIIEANIFSRNRYHLKLGPRLSGTISILRNDFIMPDESDRRADIWIVPNSDCGPGGRNSGYGSSIEGNKFGNELQASGAPRILIAGESEGKCDRTQQIHSLAWQSNAFVNGLSIIGNRISGIGDQSAPFLRSFISGLKYMTWFNNKLDGGRYTYAVEFAGGPLPAQAELHWNVQLSDGDGPSLPSRGFANIPLQLRDNGWIL